jgi:hypothetical protein
LGVKAAVNEEIARCWWFVAIILTTWEAEIGRITVKGPAWAKSLLNPISADKNLGGGRGRLYLSS